MGVRVGEDDLPVDYDVVSDGKDDPQAAERRRAGNYPKSGITKPQRRPRRNSGVPRSTRDCQEEGSEADYQEPADLSRNFRTDGDFACVISSGLRL
jgi:hypothetical protein